MTAIKTASAISAIVFLAGCGSNDLDRDSAANIIVTDEAFDPFRNNVPTPYLTNDLTYMMTTQGILQFSDDGKVLSVEALEQIEGVNEGAISLSAPQEIEITVTGLTGDSEATQRDAEFQWQYSDLPDLVRRFAIHGGTGRARLSFYDDGWRVTDMSIEQGGEPYPLTDNDLDGMNEDVLETEKRLEALFTSYRPLWESRGALVQGFRWERRNGTTFHLTIFENGVEFPSARRENSGQPTYLWFGNLDAARAEFFNTLVKFYLADGGDVFTNVDKNISPTVAEAINEAKRAFDIRSSSIPLVARRVYECEQSGDKDACRDLGVTFEH